MSHEISLIAFLHRMLQWLVVLSGLAGIGLVVVWQTGIAPQSGTVSAAGFAAGAATIFLAASVLIDFFFAGRGGAFTLADESPCRAAKGPADAASASRDKRLEVLDRRLSVDEPRLCSLSKSPCTMWSFCGEDSRHITSESQAAVQEFVLRRADSVLRYADPSLQDGTNLPVVERHNAANCPYCQFGRPSHQKHVPARE